jgi:carbonic anhydrase/acetyltransferase-like protein (isoleucine patch superfamily)
VSGGLVYPYKGVLPRIAADAFVAPNAAIIGDVEIGAQANIWFGVTVRGDEAAVRIGARANIQDGCVVHVHSKKQGTCIGADVTVGHMALLHACTIEDGGFVGMGAIILDEAVIESGGMLAAGAMLTPKKRVPAGELWAGRPARFARRLTAEEIAGMPETIENYRARGQLYLEDLYRATPGRRQAG